MKRQKVKGTGCKPLREEDLVKKASTWTALGNHLHPYKKTTKMDVEQSTGIKVFMVIQDVLIR
jgi:hypothetical protein